MLWDQTVATLAVAQKYLIHVTNEFRYKIHTGTLQSDCN